MNKKLSVSFKPSSLISFSSLVDIREQYVDLIEEAKIDKLGYEDFLIKLLIAEDEGKEQRRTEKLIAKANFDTIASLSVIDYSFNRSLDKSKNEELGSLRGGSELNVNAGQIYLTINISVES